MGLVVNELGFGRQNTQYTIWGRASGLLLGLEVGDKVVTGWGAGVDVNPLTRSTNYSSLLG